MLPRGLMFGMGAGWLLLFDVCHEAGWCSYLCPIVPFSLLGQFSLVRSRQRDACNDCWLLWSADSRSSSCLKGAKKGLHDILSGNCTNCGRCIDVCSKDVFLQLRTYPGLKPGDKVLPPHYFIDPSLVEPHHEDHLRCH